MIPTDTVAISYRSSEDFEVLPQLRSHRRSEETQERAWGTEVLKLSYLFKVSGMPVATTISFKFFCFSWCASGHTTSYSTDRKVRRWGLPPVESISIMTGIHGIIL
jgi:hypothetical protein